MQVFIEASVLMLAYVFGSIPFGLIFVKLIAGKDVRQVASGRTGGTNAARAGGAAAGLLTALMDGFKGAAAVWVAQAILPAQHWLHVLAPIAAVLGHNYSIFLAERDEHNHLRLRGGAGGGPTVGGAVGLWWPSAFIVLPLGALVFFGIGYASITTMSVALIITAIFGVRYALGLARLPDVAYGVIAFILLVWALRPNIKALVEGRERFHGWRPGRGTGLGPAAIQNTPTRPRGRGPDVEKTTAAKARRSRKKSPRKATASRS
jgi:glycerol-3-phosphate acyltransferase PlsY